MLKAFRIPIGWMDLLKRTGAEVLADNCLGLAAQLAYYFFLALFPALLFLVALIGFIPVENLMDTIVGTLSRVAPGEVLSIVQDQIVKIADDQAGGLLTFGMLGTIWSSSSGLTAVIDSLNQAYESQEGRPWWKVRLVALGLTVALAIFIIVSTVLVVAGPTLAEKVAEWFSLGAAFTFTWKILQWPVVLRAGHRRHRANLLLRAGRRTGLDLDYSGLGARDDVVVARVARVQVLRDELRLATTPPTARLAA